MIYSSRWLVALFQNQMDAIYFTIITQSLNILSMQEKWKIHLEYLEKNVNSKSLTQMASELNLDKEDLRLFLHHHRRFRINKKNNLIIRLLSELIAYPEYFSPTKNFYEQTGIGQRRWWQLFKGEKIPTEIEYKSICQHLKVDHKVSMNVRQLDLFENV